MLRYFTIVMELINIIMEWDKKILTKINDDELHKDTQIFNCQRLPQF